MYVCVGVGVCGCVCCGVLVAILLVSSLGRNLVVVLLASILGGSPACVEPRNPAGVEQLRRPKTAQSTARAAQSSARAGRGFQNRGGQLMDQLGDQLGTAISGHPGATLGAILGHLCAILSHLYVGVCGCVWCGVLVAILLVSSLGRNLLVSILGGNPAPVEPPEQ